VAKGQAQINENRMKNALTSVLHSSLHSAFWQVLCLTLNAPANDVNNSVCRQLFIAGFDASVEVRTRIWIFYENLESQ
jgi:hypothetical protein